MTIDDIKTTANAILAEEFEKDLSAITTDSSLKDVLSLDSLDMVDVAVLVDEHFGVKLVKSDFDGVKTFGDFYNLIYNKISRCS